MSTMHNEFDRLGKDPEHQVVLYTAATAGGLLVKFLKVHEDYVDCDVSKGSNRSIPFSAIVGWKDVTGSDAHVHVSVPESPKAVKETPVEAP